MSTERLERKPADFVLTTPEGQLLAHSILPNLNKKQRRETRGIILAFCQTPDGYSAFSNLVRGQLTDEVGVVRAEARTEVRSKIQAIDDLLTEKFGDLEKVKSTKLFFAFEKHPSDPSRMRVVTDRYSEIMRNVFVKGERNIWVVESANTFRAKPAGVVYPESAKEFEIDLCISAQVEFEEKNGYIPHTRNELRELMDQGKGVGYFSQAIADAVDELNAEGYNIGLLYEEGITADALHDFVGGRSKLDFGRFKNTLKKLAAGVYTRDNKLVGQIRRCVESEVTQPTNLFITRGSGHAKMLDLFPVSYAGNFTSVMYEDDLRATLGPQETLLADLIDKKTISEQQWQAGYESHCRRYQKLHKLD